MDSLDRVGPNRENNTPNFSGQKGKDEYGDRRSTESSDLKLVDSKEQEGGGKSGMMESPVPRRGNDLRLFPIERALQFQPPGVWQSMFCGKPAVAGESNHDYHISTSFVCPGFLISCPEGADKLMIECAGVETFKVLYTRNGHEQPGSGVLLKELAVPEAQAGQRQRVEVSTPWPSMKVEAVVDKYRDTFVTLFDVVVYSSMRPSSQSTPLGKDLKANRPWGRDS